MPHGPAAMPPRHPIPPHAPHQPPRRTPDPGSRSLALVALLVLIPVMVLVAALQQISIYTRGVGEPAPTAVLPPDGSDQGLLLSRVMLKIARAWPATGATGEPLNSLDALWTPAAPTPETDKPRLWRAAMDARAAELRAAIVAAEVRGPDQAIERLDRLMTRLDADAARLAALGHPIAATGSTSDAPPPGPEPEPGGVRQTLSASAIVVPVLAGDAALFRHHFAGMAAEADPPTAVEPEALSDSDWAGLDERHGWYAALARVVGLDDDSDARSALLAGGRTLLLVLGIACAALFAAFLGMLSAVTWLVVNASTGRLRRWFVPPAPGGSVYLETVALFVVSFFSIQIGIAVLIDLVAQLKPHATMIAIGSQWFVLLVIFYPLFRGVGVQQWRRDLGLIAPRGFLREVGAGLMVYLAGLPLLVVAGLIGVVLKTIQDQVFKDSIPYTTGGNPILELVSGAGVWQVIAIVSLATIWAPLVEEIVFRGCLYRHMRCRVGFLIAAPASAVAFGIMHGYELVLLGPVIALGFTFAFMREWRGSLVGAIVIHVLHNATVLALLISMTRLSA